jgi:crotonobetainyl-CoA:carnitine CoA-transferase CaiB-like acyl-CoA transferase
VADAVANQPPPLLAGVRVLEVSMLGPGAVGGYLADLGADVVKIEPPQGDYIRQMTWPIIDGVSLMHLHLNRGKRSLVLNLKNDDAREVFRDLARDADVVIEAMRPGALARMGLGYDDLVQINPKIVFCTVSGYGMTGPYASMPSHGIAYDTWAGIVTPEVDDDGFTVIPEHVSIGINAAPPIGAAAILAAVIRARDAGVGAFLDLAQSDAAAYFDWYRSETWLAYRRPEDEVTGNPSDDYERRAPGTAGMREGVRYQLYESADGHVLFMASEQAFWKNFCEGVDRMDLFDRWPGSTYADHARGNRELQAELRDIFKQRTSGQWLEFADEVNTPIAPVNTPQTVVDDPQFQARLPLLPHADHGADMLPFPVRLVGEDLPIPRHAPTVGEHTDDVLRDLLGLDDDRLGALRAGGALG